MDCILPGFSIHGIFQARVLEWVAIAFSMRAGYMPGIACFDLFPTNKREENGLTVKLLSFVFKYNVKNKDAP